MIIYKRTTSLEVDFLNLVAFLDEELKIRDGEEHAFFAQYNKTDTIRNVIIVYTNNIAVGCGAFKNFDESTVEIKRMFVMPQFRNQGIAFKILNELESWAKEINFSACILETGKRQPEAIGLYLKAGYKIIPNYGQYENIESSVCMRKII